MILIKDKENRLRLVSNNVIHWYKDCKLVKVIDDVPKEISYNKSSGLLQDILYKQLDFLDNAEKEVKKRKKCIKYIKKLINEN